MERRSTGREGTVRSSKGWERAYTSSIDGDLDTLQREVSESPPGDLRWLLDAVAAYLRLFDAELRHVSDPLEACRRCVQPLKVLTAAMERLVALGSGNGQPDSRSAALTPQAEDMHPLLGELTRRERQVMKYVEKGLPYAKIARKLDIDVQTVYTHMKHVRRKRRDHAVTLSD